MPQTLYDTPLTAEEETKFKDWKQRFAPNDSGDDYDLRGAFKSGLKPDPKTGHWPDTFKKPNHPTFSVESKYATGQDAAKAGMWTGPNHDIFVPANRNNYMQDIESILRSVKAPDAVKARAWDAYNDSKSEEEFTKALTNIPIPDEIKANLWDMKYGSVAEEPKPTPVKGMVTEAKSVLAPNESTITRGVAGVGRALTNMGAGVVEGLKANAQIPIFGPALQAAKSAWQAMQDTAEKARNAETPAEKFGYAAASGIPVVGPMVADLAERAGKGDIAGAATEAATYALTPKVVEKGVGVVSKVAERAKYAQERPLVFTKPEGHLQTSLKPDLDNQGIITAGNQLKAGEAKIGKPVKDVDTARQAAKAQFKEELMPTRRSIIDAQKDVTVPGSRRALIRAKIASIPKDILPGTKEYQTLFRQAYESVPTDLTIGQLEEMNTSLNATNRGYHQAKLSQALGKLENANGAMDVAAEKVTRELMEEGMEAHGEGGYARLKEVNKRIGALIKLEDSIDMAEKTARAEAAEPRLRKGMERFTSVRAVVKGNPTVNEGIANAMRTWKTADAPIQMGPEWGPIGTARQIPSQTSNPRYLNAMPDQSGVTGTTAPAGQHYYRQLPGQVFDAEVLGRTGGPHASGEGGPVPGTGPSFVRATQPKKASARGEAGKFKRVYTGESESELPPPPKRKSKPKK